MSAGYLLVMFLLAVSPLSFLLDSWVATGLLFLPPYLFGFVSVLLLLLCWRLKAKWEFVATALATMIAMHLYVGFHALVPRLGSVASGPILRVACWNIKGFSADMDRFADFFAGQNVDLMLFQECYGKEDALKEAFPDYEVRVDTHSDVAILSRLPVLASGDLEFSQRGVWARVRSPLGDLEVYSVHLEKGDRYDWAPILPAVRTTFYKQRGFQPRIAELLRSPLAIVGGDFNAPAASPLVRGFAKQSAFQQAGGGLDLTFPTRFPLWRLDHVLLGSGLVCTSFEVQSSDLSDHLPLLLEVRRL